MRLRWYGCSDSGVSSRVFVHVQVWDWLAWTSSMMKAPARARLVARALRSWTSAKRCVFVCPWLPCLVADPIVLRLACAQAVADLILETKEFGLLIGTMRSDQLVTKVGLVVYLLSFDVFLIGPHVLCVLRRTVACTCSTRQKRPSSCVPFSLFSVLRTTAELTPPPGCLGCLCLPCQIIMRAARASEENGSHMDALNLYTLAEVSDHAVCLAAVLFA